MQVGVFQCAAGGLTPDERIERLSVVLDGSVDLLVCPELFLSGYNVGDKVVEYAQEQNGPLIAQIAELARQSKTAIIFGYPEKAGGKLYNSAACIDDGGKLVANHRKLLLPPGFESEYFRKSEDMTVFELNNTRVAILICYDAEFPETVRACAKAGAELVIVPTALVDNWGVVANRVMPSRAFENGVYLVYANHSGTEGSFSYLGESCIVAPDGSDAARAGFGEEVITAEVLTSNVAAAQARLPYLSDVEKLKLK